MSTSMEGSVNGKCEARKRIFTSSTLEEGLAEFGQQPISDGPDASARRSTRPSIWWNIGVWVRSQSLRKVRPGAMMRIGGLPDSMVRICTGLVWVRRTMRDAVGLGVEVEGVVLLARGMFGRDVQGGEIVQVVLDMRALGDREAKIAEDLAITSPAPGSQDGWCLALRPRRQSDIDLLGGKPRLERELLQRRPATAMASAT